LPDSLIAKSYRWSDQVVKDYANGNNPNSLDVTVLDADKDPELQAHGKMAEVAFAIYAGYDPLQQVSWTRHCDGGFDLLWHNMLWDIKHTKRGFNLIWPLGKNKIFDSKHFDNLALVRGEKPNFEISGWITKQIFAKRHKVAGKNHFLEEGTRHIDMRELWGIDSIGLLW